MGRKKVTINDLIAAQELLSEYSKSHKPIKRDRGLTKKEIEREMERVLNQFPKPYYNDLSLGNIEADDTFTEQDNINMIYKCKTMCCTHLPDKSYTPISHLTEYLLDIVLKDYVKDENYNLIKQILLTEGHLGYRVIYGRNAITIEGEKRIFLDFDIS